MLQSLELASLWPELRPRRLLGRPGDEGEGGFAQQVPPRAQGFPASLFVLLGRAGAGLGVVLLAGGEAINALLAALLLCQVYFNFRFRLVLTNADHLNLAILAAATVGTLPGVSPALRIAALGFVAFQAVLAYAASGIEKLRAGHWRAGARLVQILQDSSHRFPRLGNRLAARPGWARAASWAVAVGEVLFPLGLLLPPAGFFAVIAAGLLFHAALAVIMGLPMFFWSFAATYPALYFFHGYFASIRP